MTLHIWDYKAPIYNGTVRHSLCGKRLLFEKRLKVSKEDRIANSPEQANCSECQMEVK